MKKSLIAAGLAASLALGSLQPAAANSFNDETTRTILGLAALTALGIAIANANNNNHNDRYVRSAPPPPPVRRGWYDDRGRWHWGDRPYQSDRRYGDYNRRYDHDDWRRHR